MKEPHIEGVATHDDPESCADPRKGAGEALTGARIGRVLSREILSTGCPHRSGSGRQHDPVRYCECLVGPARSETLSMYGNSVRENREIPPAARLGWETGRPGKTESKPGMNGGGKSDSRIVPTKFPNTKKGTEEPPQGRPYTGTKVETPETAKGGPKGRQPRRMESEEGMEGRRLAKGNAGEQNTFRTQGRGDVPRALDRVRQAAKRDKEAKFTTLMSHVTIELLGEAYQKLNRHAAPGIDEETWEAYRADLEENLKDLHERLHSGRYRASPSRRVYIPKSDGKARPIGISTLEDKIAQRAVVEVMNAIYEEDFLGFSYGFRPRRSQHDALDALTVGILRKKVNWVFDVDIRGYFDSINHGWLEKFLEHRIGDKRLLRLIKKWMKAGVMEQGQWKASEQGTAQGASLSPLLANIYLHYAFDLWIQQWRTREAYGEVIAVRYADDIIVGFQHQREAQRCQREMQERLRKFSLELHPEKTRLIEFGAYAAERRQSRGMGKPETFDFLGFTHISGKARSGNYLLIRQTIAKRMRARLKELKREIMRRRHLPIKKQGQWLGRVVKGYLNYHAVPTNSASMQQFRKQVTRHWHRALRRRSQRDRTNWARMNRLADRYLPRALIQHPWPTERFDAKTRGGSPVR